MAHRTRIPVSVIYGWRRLGQIPTPRHEELFRLAATLDVPLQPSDFFEVQADEEDPVSDCCPCGSGHAELVPADGR
jgi:hypothetical protein